MRKFLVFGLGLAAAALSGCSTMKANDDALSSAQAKIVLMCQGKVEVVNGKVTLPDISKMSTEQYQTYVICVHQMEKATNVKVPELTIAGPTPK